MDFSLNVSANAWSLSVPSQFRGPGIFVSTVVVAFI